MCTNEPFKQDFNHLADEVLEQLGEDMEALADHHPQGQEFDISLSSGVLNLFLNGMPTGQE